MCRGIDGLLYNTGKAGIIGELGSMIRAFLRVARRSIGDPRCSRVGIGRGRRRRRNYDFAFPFLFIRVFPLVKNRSYWRAFARGQKKRLVEKRKEKRRGKKRVARCPDVRQSRRGSADFSRKSGGAMSAAMKRHVTLARPLASCLICIQCYEYRMSIRVCKASMSRYLEERPFVRARR